MPRRGGRQDEVRDEASGTAGVRGGSAPGLHGLLVLRFRRRLVVGGLLCRGGRPGHVRVRGTRLHRSGARDRPGRGSDHHDALRPLDRFRLERPPPPSPGRSRHASSCGPPTSSPHRPIASSTSSRSARPWARTNSRRPTSPTQRSESGPRATVSACIGVRRSTSGRAERGARPGQIPRWSSRRGGVDDQILGSGHHG